MPFSVREPPTVSPIVFISRSLRCRLQGPRSDRPPGSYSLPVYFHPVVSVYSFPTDPLSQCVSQRAGVDCRMPMPGLCRSPSPFIPLGPAPVALQGLVLAYPPATSRGKFLGVGVSVPKTLFAAVTTSLGRGVGLARRWRCRPACASTSAER